MATYNRGHLVQQTIENIFEQDYKSIELIVVNDSSTDNTQQVLERLQGTYKIIVEKNSKNLGLQKSLNKGLRLAKGVYIARIDDHDKWIDKGKLSKQIEFLEKKPEVGLLGTAYMSDGKIMLNPQNDQSIRAQMLFRCPFCHVSLVIRKAVLEKVGCYDETLTYSEDWELWMRIGQHFELANLPDVTTEIINEEASLSGSYYLRQLPINRSLVKKYRHDYPHGLRAIIYHYFIYCFFTLIPIDSMVHNWMKKIFHRAFLSG